MEPLKLTPKQKQVIELMRKGATLSRHKEYSKHIRSIAPWVILGQTQIKLSDTLVNFLMEEILVKRCDQKSTEKEVFYELTEFGKIAEL